MVEFSFDLILLLALIAYAAGTIDAIAGGGGLLTVPALLTAGLPPHLALGTNKLQSSCGTAVAVWRFTRAGLIDWRQLWPLVLGSVLGGVLGTLLVQQIAADFLQPIIPALLIAIALYFILVKPPRDTDAKSRMTMRGFALTLAPIIGCYDGFFGPGTGAFFTLAIVTMLGWHLPRAAASTRALNLASNLAALIAFVAAGQVIWAIGLMMAVANMLGGYTGSHLAMRHGVPLIRWLLVAVCIALCVRLWLWG